MEYIETSSDSDNEQSYNTEDILIEFIYVVRCHRYEELKNICEMINNNVNRHIIMKKINIDKEDLHILFDMNDIIKGKLKYMIRTIKKDYISMEDEFNE